MGKNSKVKAFASNRIRFQGRFIPKALEAILFERKVMPAAGAKEIKKEYPSVKNYGDFLRIVQELLPETAIVSDTSWGLKNEKRSREDFDSIITIVERINTDPIYKHLNIVTIDKNGVEIIGKVAALEAIKDFETELVKSLQKEGAAYVQFKHFGSINVGDLTFTIDLRNSEVTPQFSA